MDPRVAPSSPAAEVVAAIRSLGAGVDARAVSEVTAEVGDRQYSVEVRRVVREIDAPGLVARVGGPDMVVADRISVGARRILNEASVPWLDRRGHLRLKVPGLLVDADVPSSLPPQDIRVVDPFSPTGLDVSLALLLDPEAGLSGSEIARRTERSSGRVAEILVALRTRGLVSKDGRPIVPDLFWATADAWEPRWEPLAYRPTPDAHVYRLSGSLGTVSHQAPMLVSADWPPELYVPDERHLRAVVRAIGGSAPREPAALVAVCPSRYGWSVCAPGTPLLDGFPAANHVVVALDLAQDQGRGREVLESWTPNGATRVW